MLDDDRLRWTLGLGATAGIAAMALVLSRRSAAAGVRFRPRLDFRHPAVRRLLTLSGWTLGYVVANQVASSSCATSPTRARATPRAYFDAFTFFVLPHGLLAVSIATTFVPEMARVGRPPRPAVVHATRRRSASA